MRKTNGFLQLRLARKAISVSSHVPFAFSVPFNFSGEPDLPGYEEATQDGGRRRSWYAENPALASPASKTMDEARL